MTEEEIRNNLYTIFYLAKELATSDDPFLAVDLERVAAILADKIKMIDPEGWLEERKGHEL